MSWIWIINILSVFFLCVFFAGIVIPQILLIAFRKNLFDVPNERKIHKCVVPRLGGIAFKPVMFLSFALLLAINLMTGHDEVFKEILEQAESFKRHSQPRTYAMDNVSSHSMAAEP